MLQIEIEKVWSNTIVLQLLSSDRFRRNGALENLLWLWNLFDYLVSMFREVFLINKNKIFLNFVMNL
jgi:hypothetical protein